MKQQQQPRPCPFSDGILRLRRLVHTIQVCIMPETSVCVPHKGMTESKLLIQYFLRAIRAGGTHISRIVVIMTEISHSTIATE